MYEIIDVDLRALPAAYNEFSSTLRAILPHLTRVHRLTVKMITWARTSEDIKIQLASLSHVVSVAWFSVHLNRLDELVMFSNESFPALGRIHLQYLQVKYVAQIERSMILPHTNRFECLRALRFYVEESVVPVLSVLTSNIIPLQKIDTLRVEVFDKSSLDQVGCLIRATGSILTVLKFQIYVNWGDRFEVSTRDHCQSLLVTM
ncbi:hypothetical protein E4T56_gene16397 [Termitomyces sp. T112]|nr:hypothetical protein E4T56_gene16397 [Termitomyces sp. T112]